MHHHRCGFASSTGHAPACPHFWGDMFTCVFNPQRHNLPRLAVIQVPKGWPQTMGANGVIASAYLPIQTADSHATGCRLNYQNRSAPVLRHPLSNLDHHVPTTKLVQPGIRSWLARLSQHCESRRRQDDRLTGLKRICGQRHLNFVAPLEDRTHLQSDDLIKSLRKICGKMLANVIPPQL